MSGYECMLAEVFEDFAFADLMLVQLELVVDLKRYNPNQPRVPRGNPDGGQWTSVGGWQ